MVWNVIAAVASVLAVFAALATVRLTINYRREERLRHLAEALTFVVTTAEDHPGASGPAPELPWRMPASNRLSASWTGSSRFPCSD
jgi:hypothetical protein